MARLAPFLFFLLVSSVQAEYYVYDFSATWCKPCQEVKLTLENPQVKEKLKEFYGDKAWVFDWDVESDKRYFEYYNIDSVPTLLIVDESGKVIKKHSGTITKENLLIYLNLP